MIDFAADADGDRDPDLSPRDERLALMLARGMSRVQAARKLGISTRTVQRSLARPGFLDRVAELRKGVLAEAVGVLAGLAGKASVALGKLLDDEDPRIKLAASDRILSHVVRMTELTDLADRLARLEAAEEPDPAATGWRS